MFHWTGGVIKIDRCFTDIFFVQMTLNNETSLLLANNSDILLIEYELYGKERWFEMIQDDTWDDMKHEMIDDVCSETEDIDFVKKVVNQQGALEVLDFCIENYGNDFIEGFMEKTMEMRYRYLYYMIVDDYIMDMKQAKIDNFNGYANNDTSDDSDDSDELSDAETEKGY
jgi:hypothetical protein